MTVAALEVGSPGRAAEPLRVALFQRRLAPFRVPIFGRLAQEPGIALTLVVAQEPRNAGDLPFECRVLPGRSLPLGRSRLLLQRGALEEAARHDVVVLEGSMRFLTSVGLVLAKSRHRAATVWWTSLYDPTVGRVAWPHGLKSLLLGQVLGRVEGVATYSEAAASALRGRTSPRCSVVVAPNVLDTERLAQAEAAWLDDPARMDRFARDHGLFARQTVLFIGRLIPAKRLDDLLLAFQRLWSRRPDLEPLLAIVGDGPERERMQASARTLGVAANVRWFGEIRDVREVCPFFLQSKVLLLPGSGGLAIYQALAHGVPVVAAHADGTERDFVREGKTGFLCEPGDVETIAQRVEQILALESEAWLDLSMDCRKLATQDFHVRFMIRGLREAIEVAAAARSEEHSRRTSPRRNALVRGAIR
jgi:glycosyltransferase involved in cell wall biosynthesis